MKGDFIGIVLTVTILLIFAWYSQPQLSMTISSKHVVPRIKTAVNEDREFLMKMREIQHQRKQILLEACERYRDRIGSVDVVEDPPWNIAINDEHKLLYCFTPKIASTSWKRILLVLNGFMNDTEFLPQTIINRVGMKSFDYLEERSPEDIKEILGSYTKFMFVRHPFSRVLSAFRNKLSPDTSFNQSQIWRDKLGNYITTLYSEPSNDNYNLTFKDFVHFLIDENQKSHKHWINPHWGFQYDRCRPCDIDYDIIGKFESLEEDANYVMKIAQIDNIASFPSSNGSNPTNSSSALILQTFFSNLPLNFIQLLYKRFEIDFQIFGYSESSIFL